MRGSPRATGSETRGRTPSAAQKLPPRPACGHAPTRGVSKFWRSEANRTLEPALGATTVLTAAASSRPFTALPAAISFIIDRPFTPPQACFAGDRHGGRWAKRRQATFGGWREDAMGQIFWNEY